MNQARWETVKSLFFEAIVLTGEERQAFLKRVEATDVDVSAELRELLAQSPEARLDLRNPCWAEAEEAPAARTFEIGRTLGDRFEITGFLGAGGLGEVFRAFDHHQKIHLAVKTLRPELLSDPAAAAILRNELNTARAVTHPNVCRVFDIQTNSDGAPTFFTMELLEGETLARRLHDGAPFNAEEAEPLVGQILDGLGAIHRAGILHRDLKTGNIILTDGGTRAVVMDFGLAREMKGSGDLQSTLSNTHVAGTLAYMAPEQLRGQRASVASDIHALGVVLFEMTTGRRPFDGVTPMEIAASRLNHKAQSPRQFAPVLDRRWEHTILRCLEQDAAQRPQSTGEVRRLLTERAPSRRHTRRSFAIAGLATAGAAAATVFRSAMNSPESLSIGVADIENKTGDSGLEYLCRGTTNELIRRLSSVQGVNVIRLYKNSLEQSSLQGHGLILAGGLLRNAGHLRWQMYLLDQQTRKPIWSSGFEQQEKSDVVALQAQIAEDVRTRLDQYRSMPASYPAGPQTSKGLALDHFMRGRNLLEQASPASTRAAIESLQNAIKEDPQFALAWSALADAHLSLMAYVTGQSNRFLDEALSCAQHAVELDRTLPEAHASLAAVQQQMLDWKSCEQSYLEALRLKPYFPRAHRWYAGFVLQFGRFEETLEHSQIALKQDPYDALMPMSVGLYLLFSGRPMEAIQLMEPSVEGRDLAGTRHNLGQAYARMAQLTSGGERQAWLRKAFGQAAAVAAIETRQNHERPLLSDRMYPLFYAIAGNSEAAEKHVSRLREDMDQGKISPAAVGWSYAIERNYAPVLDLLERAYAESARGLIYIKVNPFLENLRGEQRFQRLIRDLRL